jgi:hypothetical protein
MARDLRRQVRDPAEREWETCFVVSCRRCHLPSTSAKCSLLPHADGCTIEEEEEHALCDICVTSGCGVLLLRAVEMTSLVWLITW